MLRATIGTVVFVVPVTVTFMDKVACVSRVTGNSMQPCLNPDHRKANDYVILNKWAASDFKFHRGEIVTYIAPNDPSLTVIKRIVALEGDTVRPSKGKQKLVTIPQGHCWVEGDNRRVSIDSNLYGPLSISLITAKATRVVWPPSRWQKLNTTETDCDRVIKVSNSQTISYDETLAV